LGGGQLPSKRRGERNGYDGKRPQRSLPFKKSPSSGGQGEGVGAKKENAGKDDGRGGKEPGKLPFSTGNTPLGERRVVKMIGTIKKKNNH